MPLPHFDGKRYMSSHNTRKFKKLCFEIEIILFVVVTFPLFLQGFFSKFLEMANMPSLSTLIFSATFSDLSIQTDLSIFSLPFILAYSRI